jgi:hypothetical protein
MDTIAELMQQGADKYLRDSYGDFPMVRLRKESYCRGKEFQFGAVE